LSQHTIGKSERNKFECSICLDDVSMTDIATIQLCGHQFCKRCVKSYLDVQCANSQKPQVRTQVFKKEPRVIVVEQNHIYGVPCPSKGCKVIIDAMEIKKLSNPHTFEKFDNFSLKHAITQLEEVPTCTTCKNYNVAVEHGLLNCRECGSVFCAYCGKAPHSKTINCTSFKECEKVGIQDEAKFLKWATAAGVYLCPSCHVPIEKNGGCSHMHCTECDTDFDWIYDALSLSGKIHNRNTGQMINNIKILQSKRRRGRR